MRTNSRACAVRTANHFKRAISTGVGFSSCLLPRIIFTMHLRELILISSAEATKLMSSVFRIAVV